MDQKVLNLVQEVEQIAQKVLQHRTTLQDDIYSILASHLAFQWPIQVTEGPKPIPILDPNQLRKYNSSNRRFQTIPLRYLLFWREYKNRRPEWTN